VNTDARRRGAISIRLAPFTTPKETTRANMAVIDPWTTPNSVSASAGITVR